MTRQDLVDLTCDRALLFLDGFDAAIVGVSKQCGKPNVVVYEKGRCIEIIMQRDDVDLEDALSDFGHNVSGGWWGERTPAFLVKP